jgi:hypothetical protein
MPDRERCQHATRMTETTARQATVNAIVFSALLAHPQPSCLHRR